MRKDIEIHINTGDIALSARNKFSVRPFAWVDNQLGLARYAYGEIEVPASIPESHIRDKGLFVTIPYTPIYKEFHIRIKRVYDGGACLYLMNQVDGSEWFLVKAGLYGGKVANIRASELCMVSELAFHIQFEKGMARLFSATQSDVNIIKADRQNSNMMLKCVPTNNYRYPLTGVGLIRWMKSNINHTRLAETLRREFANDGIGIKSASFDFDTNNLNLELDMDNR
jgi:hypothetical protein